MDIIVANEHDAAEWDRIVEDTTHGTIFHTWNWLKIIEKHTESRLYPLMGYEDKEPAALIPLFYRKKIQMRMVFSPPPHTALFFLGPLMIEYEKKKQHKKENEFENFHKSVDVFLKDDLKANYVTISLPPGLYDTRPYLWTGYSITPGFDYIRYIDKGIDHEWQMIPKKVRQNINRASKRGISVVEGGRKDLERIIELMNTRYMEQNKLVTVPKGYILDLYEKYPKNIKVFIAQYDEESISGVISIIHKDQLLSWIGNPKINIPDLPSPNEMLIWEEIKFGCSNGLKQYVTLGAATNERLHTYYSSKMNPDLQMRFTVKKLSPLAGIIEGFYSKVLKPMNIGFH